MLLSKPAIERYMKTGDITIHPFDERNLKSAQYDVTLGEFCYREAEAEHGAIYNPFDEQQVRRKWQPDRGIRHGDLVDDGRLYPALAGVGLDEKIILVRPGELILAHTEEFIGGSGDKVTTMMKARSSMGRSFFEVCRCAGCGDVGYFSRWTMEIANTSRYHTIPLVVGRRVAQILFFEVEPVSVEDQYQSSGKYQASAKLEELVRDWTPEQMLPKQWRDRECSRFEEVTVKTMFGEVHAIRGKESVR